MNENEWLSSSSNYSGGLMRGLGVPFWRLFGSSATSNLADGIGRVALPLLAATLTRDPVLISALTAAMFLPWLLFGLLSGALVDRVDRRRAMAVAGLLRAAALGGLTVAVLVDAASIPVIYVVAFVVGVGETVYDSAARAALPQLIRRDQLDQGNSLIATGEAVGQSLLGPPVGALLFAAATTVALAANAVGFLVAGMAVLALRQHLNSASGERTSVRADIADGLRFLFTHRLLRGLTLLTGCAAIGVYMAIAVQVLYVLETLGLSAAAYGMIVTVSGAGGVLGSLTAPWVSARIGRSAGLVAAVLASATATVVIGLTTSPVLAAVMFGLSSLAFAVWDVLWMSLRQAIVPPELLGRVLGSYRTLVWGAFPVGALAGGALAAATSVPTVYLVGGALNLAVGAAVWRLVRIHHTQITAAFDPLDASAASRS